MNMEQAIKDLQDAVTVMAHLEKQQSDVLLEHSKRIVELEGYRLRIDQNLDKASLNLAEITDKLNGLIGYMDGQHRPPAS